MQWFCESAKSWEGGKRHERVYRETCGRDCGKSTGLKTGHYENHAISGREIGMSYSKRRDKTSSFLESLRTRLDLEAVAFAGGYFVQDRIDEEAEDQARDESGDDDDGEGFLRVAAYAGRHGGGEQAEAGYESGHHDGAEAQERSFACGLANGGAFKAQLVGITDEAEG